MEAPDYADFDKKVEILRSFLQAHCDEDLEAQSAFLSDTLQWSPPTSRGNDWVGEDDYLAALKNYHDNFEDIKFTEGISINDNVGNGMWSGSVFPKETATSSPNVIRFYGTWTATHTETGKGIGVKYYGLAFFNEANEIVRFSDYFDVNGLAVQIAEE